MHLSSDSQTPGQKKSRKPQLSHSSSGGSLAPIFASGGIPYTQQVLIVSSPIDRDYSSSSSHCSSASSNASHFSIPTNQESSVHYTPCDRSSHSGLPPMLPPPNLPKKKLIGLSATQRSYFEEKKGGGTGQRDATSDPSLPKPLASYFSWPEPQHMRHKSPHSPQSPLSPQLPLSPQSPRSLLSPHRNSVQRMGGRDRAGSIVSPTGGSGPMRLRRQSVSYNSSPIYGDAAARSRRGSRMTLGPDDFEKLRRGSLVSLQQALQTSIDLLDSPAPRAELSSPTRARLTRPRAASRLVHEMAYTVFPADRANTLMSAPPSGLSTRTGGVTLPPLRQLGITSTPRVRFGMDLTLGSPAQGGIGTGTGITNSQGISRAVRIDEYSGWSDPPASPAPFSCRAPSFTEGPDDGMDVGPLEDAMAL